MRKIMFFFLATVLLGQSGCGADQTTVKKNVPTRVNNSSSSKIIPPSVTTPSRVAVQTKDESNDAFSIPKSNSKAPDGVLQQLSWLGTGGEPDDPVCGKCSVVLNDDFLSMEEFIPFERIGLLIYRSTGSNECNYLTADFVTILEVEVDENGDLLAQLDGDTDNLFVVCAYDLATEEIVWDLGLPYYHEAIICPPSTNHNGCPGAPNQRLIVNKMAYVCTSIDTVKLREGPGKDYSILKSLVPGAVLKVVGGPVCANNWSWWKVETESGYVGWMSEGGDNIDPYFLCPME